MPVITESFPCEPNHTYDVLEVQNGRRFPYPFSDDTLNNIPHLKLRDDDVMICGYMRSGTHWVFEILNMLLIGKVETIPEIKESFHLEQAPQEKLDKFPSPRVLNTHLLFEELPREVTDRKTKVIYLVRDPRDSLTSWYTLTLKIWKTLIENWYISFPDWLQLNNEEKLEWGSWFLNLESWEKAIREHPDHPILVVYYEDLIQDTFKSVMAMKEFLGLERDAEFCKQVAEKTQFKKMVKDKEKYTEKFGGLIVHYNKGIIGNWRTMFTVSMMEEFDQLYERKMAGSQFRDRYSRSGRS